MVDVLTAPGKPFDRKYLTSLEKQVLTFALPVADVVTIFNIQEFNRSFVDLEVYHDVERSEFMVNATHIQTEADLQHVLATGGFICASPVNAPAWHFWQSQWHNHASPIASYLVDFPDDDFFVAVRDGVFQVYEQDKQNFWFHVIGEIEGIVSEADFALQVHLLTRPSFL